MGQSFLHVHLESYWGPVLLDIIQWTVFLFGQTELSPQGSIRPQFWNTTIALRCTQSFGSKLFSGDAFLLLELLGHNGHAVHTDQLTSRWFIGSGQVEEVVGWAVWFAFSHQQIVLSLADHLAAVGNRLDIIFVLVAGLVQGVLWGRRSVFSWSK